MELWKKIDETSLKVGYFPLIDKTFKMPNGKIEAFTCLYKNDVATILMLTHDQKVVAAKQFRPGPEKFMLDPPGGNVEKGQTPEETAMSELVQETGYSFEKIEYAGSTYQDPYETRKRHIFVALGCSRKSTQDQNLEEHEYIEVEEIPLNEYFALAVKGDEMTDSLIVFRALLHLGYLTFKTP